MEQIDFLTFVEVQNILDGFDTPDLHIQVADWLIDTEHEPDRLLQVFRGAGKSHLIALYVVFLLVQDPNTTIIVMSAKNELAADNARHIRRVIEQNPFAKHLKGADKWTDSKFYVQRSQNTRNASVACSSLESDNVGTRCDIMIIDDLETDKNSVTEKQRTDMRAAIAEFMTIAKKQRTYIGTPHAVDSIYTHLQELKYPCLRIAWTKEIWKDHPDGQFTQEWADRYRAQNPSWKWNSQYLLIPDSPNTALIQTDMVQRYDGEVTATEIWGATDAQNTWHVDIEGRKIIDYAVYWDPATGLAGRDNSTLAVVYKDTENNVFLHRLVVLPPKSNEHGYRQQCERIVQECQALQISRVIVEGTETTTLDTELKAAAKDKNVWLHIIRKPRTRNKTAFIAEHIEPLVHSNRFFAHSSVPHIFYSELTDFPNGKHDDCIDATAGAISELRGDVMMLGKAKVISSYVNGSSQIDFNTTSNLSRF